MTAGAHDEFNLAMAETQYRDAIRSLVAATGLAATYQDERDKARADVIWWQSCAREASDALARIEQLAAGYDLNSGSAYAYVAADIRAAIEAQS